MAVTHCPGMDNRDTPKGDGAEPLELSGEEPARKRKLPVRLKPSFRKPPVEADQRTFEPERAEDLVPASHWVRGLVRLVEAFDLSGLVATYELDGHPPYPPERLLAVWVVGMALGFRSTRRLAEAVLYDARLVVAAKRMRPSYRTLGRFRVRLESCLPGLLGETIKVGLREGVIKGSDLGLDGTKMMGNTRQSLPRRVNEFVERALRETAANDALEGCSDEFEDKDPPSGSGGGSDPEARKMRTRTGFVTGYNAQAATDMDSGMALCGAVSAEANDGVCLGEPFAAAVGNLGGRAKTLTTDKGYDSAENLALVEAAGVEPYLPGRDGRDSELVEASVTDGKVFCEHGYELAVESSWVDGHGKRRVRWHFRGCEVCRKEYTLPEGVDPAVRVRRARRMRTEEAVRLLGLRGKVVERLFGCLKWNRGFFRFLLRGLRKVNLEWLLMLLVHNLAILVRRGVGDGCLSPSARRDSGSVALTRTLRQLLLWARRAIRTPSAVVRACDRLVVSPAGSAR